MNSDKSRLVILFHFFAMSREDSPSIDFLFVEQAARNPALEFFVLRESVVKSPGGWFYCRQPLDYFYRHAGRNSVCYWNCLEYHVFLNFVYDGVPFFAACQLQCILVLFSETNSITNFTSTDVYIKACV